MYFKDYGLRTKQRSSLRLFLGKAFYTIQRYILWASGRFKFALKNQCQPLPFILASHKTPLLRRLKAIDMKYQYNKITTLKIAAKKLNGVIVMPGETFSYWRLIGRPTYRKGYLDGMVLKNGKVTYGCAGGMCQLSNLIYRLTLHTPLMVTERHRHSYDVFPDSDRTQPFGSGATCFYPYGDLMIYNPTDKPYQLYLAIDDEFLYGKWLSITPSEYTYNIVEKNHLMKSEWWGGYSRHNEIYKQVFAPNGELISEELAAENHAMMMYSPFLEEKQPN